jgi:hypothetical protein
VTRYIGRHGTKRVAKAVLISAEGAARPHRGRDARGARRSADAALAAAAANPVLTLAFANNRSVRRVVDVQTVVLLATILIDSGTGTRNCQGIRAAHGGR